MGLPADEVFPADPAQAGFTKQQRSCRLAVLLLILALLLISIAMSLANDSYPLANPGILGVNAGAALGTVVTGLISFLTLIEPTTGDAVRHWGVGSTTGMPSGISSASYPSSRWEWCSDSRCRNP